MTVGPGCEAKCQVGGIFNINLQSTLAAEGGFYPIYFAKDPAQVIQFVAEF